MRYKKTARKNKTVEVVVNGNPSAFSHHQEQATNANKKSSKFSFHSVLEVMIMQSLSSFSLPLNQLHILKSIL